MIKHVLADGTELTSIEGRVIPPTGKTEAVYRLIAQYLVDRQMSKKLSNQVDAQVPSEK